jgi:putative transcriptional regulator
MNFHKWYGISDLGIISEIAGRVKQIRLNKNVSQKELADHIGIDRGHISKFENGKPITLLSLTKIMRALEMLEDLDKAIPIVPISPIALMKIQEKQRKRASKKNRG